MPNSKPKFGEWFPIDDKTPRDNTVILLGKRSSWVCWGYWESDGTAMEDQRPGWTCGDYNKYEELRSVVEEPTHWMPLPEPPK